MFTARSCRAVNEEAGIRCLGSGLLGGRGLGSSLDGLGDLSSLGGLSSGEELRLPLGQRLGVGSGDLGLLPGAGAATGAGQQALGGGVGDDAGEQGDGADGVVVAGDAVGGLVRVLRDRKSVV